MAWWKFHTINQMGLQHHHHAIAWGFSLKSRLYVMYLRYFISCTKKDAVYNCRHSRTLLLYQNRNTKYTVVGKLCSKCGYNRPEWVYLRRRKNAQRSPTFPIQIDEPSGLDRRTTVHQFRAHSLDREVFTVSLISLEHVLPCGCRLPCTHTC